MASLLLQYGYFVGVNFFGRKRLDSIADSDLLVLFLVF